MLFMTYYTIRPEHRDTALARFKETGGTPPAEGVTMLNRWHDASGNRGWTISESDSAEAIHKWVLAWSDVLSIQVTPILTDEEFARSLE